MKNKMWSSQNFATASVVVDVMVWSHHNDHNECKESKRQLILWLVPGRGVTHHWSRAAEAHYASLQGVSDHRAGKWYSSIQIMNYVSKLCCHVTHGVETLVRWIPRRRSPVEYVALKVQLCFPQSLLGCGRLWVGDNLFLLWDYLCLLYPYSISCFAVGPQYHHRCFYFCQKHHLKVANKILEKFHVGLKLELGFVEQILI